MGSQKNYRDECHSIQNNKSLPIIFTGVEQELDNSSKQDHTQTCAPYHKKILGTR